VPIHGELRLLVQHAKLAHELGIAKKDIAVIENGYPLTFGWVGTIRANVALAARKLPGWILRLRF
jgi:mRNA degradation ribonuclease J1/J2